jgi:peptidyl-prolyl cis-trans isomerase B (cyclophilin B)
VGTDKRERQKANRQLKLEEMARDARKRKTKKRGLQIGVGIPVLIILVFVLVRLFGTDDTSTITTASSSTTIDPTATSIIDSLATSTSSATPADPLPCPAEDGSSAAVATFPAAPTMCIDTAKTYTVEVTTSLGSYTAVLDPKKAPLAVNSFVYLARYHYFDNTPCHRIIPGFVIQCGDPTGTGSGGPGYSFADELPAAGEYKLGSLAMANSGADTNGSQFFVISGDAGVALDPNYTLFGQVTDGLDVVAQLDAVGTAAGTPSSAVTITSVTVTES